MPAKPDKAILVGWLAYTLVADRIRERILNRTYPAGTALPSEKKLRTEFVVSRSTMRRALKMLEDDGLIVTIRSQGRQVADGLPYASYRYAWIAGQVRKAIARGDLPVTRKIPSAKVLRQVFATSEATIRRAMKELEAEGLVKTFQGMGRFVMKAVPEAEPS
ncbi:GntR family transcriptional regulator [Streptosporangiaceae bacterium NEAU-GS5]|nr:GntR family transcriptional regulator [Streptosporangiaceae bacterium NEAU-GS5]